MSNLHHPGPPSGEDPVADAVRRVEATSERVLFKVDEVLLRGTSDPARLMKIGEVADHLRISERDAWERVAAGEIPRVRLSARVVRFTRESVDAYVRRCAADQGRS